MEQLEFKTVCCIGYPGYRTTHKLLVHDESIGNDSYSICDSCRIKYRQLYKELISKESDNYV